MKTSGIIVAAFCMVLFYGATAQPVEAQDAPPARSSAMLQPWKSTDETTFAAAIQEAVSKNPPGAPPGLNVLMTGSQQPLYVNVGPHLGKALKQSLIAGQVIRVVGIVRNLNGQNYLLARELQIGDQKIEVRNERGFFTYPSVGSSSARPDNSKFGGAR